MSMHAIEVVANPLSLGYKTKRGFIGCIDRGTEHAIL